MQPPEDQELEQPLVLIKPAHWATLWCFVAILLAILGAASWGSIPIRVAGEGLFFNPAEIFNVTAPEVGTVSRIDVHLATEVKKGDVVIELYPHRDIAVEEEGVVFAIDVIGGSNVNIGQPLIWFQKRSNERLQMTGLIGKKEASELVKIGMPVEISVGSANPVNYGRLMGKVSAFIPFWTVRSRDLFPTKHLNLPPGPEQFTHLIVVDLIPNPDVPSGLQWTSGNGPPYPIKLGDPCTFTVIIEKKKPISYLIP